MNKLIYYFLILFSISCVFDPADLIFSLKIPLFTLCLITTLLFNFSNKKLTFNKELLIYTLCFISIPFFSICVYFLRDGSYPYEGFSLFKSFILILLTFVFYINKINFIKPLSQILTLLSLVIIFTYVFIFVQVDYYYDLYTWGNKYGLINIGEREYSGDLTYFSVFYVTSPMIIVSLAYYFDKFLKSSDNTKSFYLIIVIINFFGMILAGTRNNIIMAIFTPIIIYFLIKRKGYLFKTLIIFSIFFLLLSISNYLFIIFDPSEFSNNIKLNLIKDYINIFSDPLNLIFGQGLGSYYFWEAKSLNYFITELTYIEIIRNFGLILGLFMIYLMFYPLSFYFQEYMKSERSVKIAYFLYLIMAFTNPIYFSSLGIFILSIILANIFINYEKFQTK